MNKTNRIRAFFLLGSGLLIGSSVIWNHVMEKSLEEQEIQLQTEEMPEESAAEVSKEETPFEYVIVDEEGYLTVYRKDFKTVYLKTNISYWSLEKEMRERISQGYLIKDVQELYDFLENYSS